jgi:hypothetical protein
MTRKDRAFVAVYRALVAARGTLQSEGMRNGRPPQVLDQVDAALLHAEQAPMGYEICREMDKAGAGVRP